MDNKTLYNNFKRITGYDVERLIGNFIDFINNDSTNIIRYYDGILKEANADSFSSMYDLIRDSKKCLEVFSLNKKNFQNRSYWGLLEQIEDIKIKTETISRIYLYLRSFLSKQDFSVGVERDIEMGKYDTVEKIIFREMQVSSFDNEWVDVALSNKLEEEDYLDEGGTILKINFPRDSRKLFLRVVLGKLQGELVYGIDLDKSITFVNDDLNILTPKKTIRQAVDTYLGMKRGDNPEFPNDGIQKELFVGSNIGSLSFPILFRQLTNLFKKDDTIASFAIKNIKFKGDALSIDFIIQTVFGDLQENSLKK